ncbi:hypothetical protein LguiA_013973 [Lonicera macranthoides]
MEATVLNSYRFSPSFFGTKHFNNRGSQAAQNIHCRPLCARSYVSLRTIYSESGRRRFVSLNRPFYFKLNRNLPVYFSHQLRSDQLSVEGTDADSLSGELSVTEPAYEASVRSSHDLDSFGTLEHRPKAFKNRFLNFVRLGSVLNSAAESFFKSEIRRRLFVTAVLIVISRVGYFIPLPGFDRRVMPEAYLSGSVVALNEIGDFGSELKLSLFQLGISPQIGASIVMQVLCHAVPSLIKLRKEGLDGHEKIKSYIWWISLGLALVEGLIVAIYSLPYSIHGVTYGAKHLMITTFLLACGAMTQHWICDKISNSGFGQGSSLIICVGILTGYTDTLHNMLSQLSGSAVSWWPYVLAVLGVFTVVTMSAVVITEGCRKIKLRYYGFKLASAAREDSPILEVEPYIPFNINPAGMHPILTTAYLFAVPSILARFLRSPFWEHVGEVFNPKTSLGARPWVYYSFYALCVFLFNIFDIANMPKEIADYLNKMGARIPSIKPGKATIEYLTKIQASTRFWGGILLSFLATASTILDHYLRRINEGFSIGFTSVLIIVGSIIELRRSYQAYNVMPSLSKALRRNPYVGIAACHKLLLIRLKGTDFKEEHGIREFVDENAGSGAVLPPGVYTLWVLRAFGEKGWCPYLLVRHMVQLANAVVYSYQYLLDPKVAGIISKEKQRESVMVFDEAHNIIYVCIEAISVSVQTQTLEGATRNLSKMAQEIDGYVHVLLLSSYLF